MSSGRDVKGSVLITKLEQMNHSKITQELENANKLMADMIGSLDTDFLSPSSCQEMETSLDKQGMARSRTGSMSSSQPDITIAEDESPPIPPRDVHVTTPTHKLPLRTILRANSEHSLLTQSLSISRSEPSSPFHSTKPVGRSISISEQGSPGKRGKAVTMERPNPKTKKQKKGGSMGDHYKRGSGPGINVTASLNVASLQGFDSNKSPKRSKWDGIRKITKKFKRSPSLDGEELQGLQARYARKGSLASDNLMSTGVNLPDGGGAPRRQRRSSSSYGNSVALVSKIFAVLTCWQDQFFEVRIQM